MPELQALLARGSEWLTREALPLWGGAGFDRSRQCFEEQLDFDGSPVRIPPQRLMVQARQIAVYAAAALCGRYADGAQIALAAARSMFHRYWEVDGTRGWVFAIDRDARVVDPRRDLYAHAFVLFSLAWLLRLEREPLFVRGLDSTVRFLDEACADRVHGGYLESSPATGSLRRQNPHMHLFEAFLELYAATGREEFLGRARALQRLATARFIDPATGMLRELYDGSWNVSPSPGQGIVEPGHQLEWAWLLDRYQRMSGEDQSRSVRRLIDAALRHGTDPHSGRVVDELHEDGRVRTASSRLWPHTEGIKALSAQLRSGQSGSRPMLIGLCRRLLDIYCAPSLRGGWIDRLDEHDRPLSLVMPASSLYHIYFGLAELTSPGEASSTPSRPPPP